MNIELVNVLRKKGVDIIRFVDVSEFPSDQATKFPNAILLCITLSKEFILAMHNNLPIEYDEFLPKEQKVEEIADWLAEYIREKGYNAISQSEQSNRTFGYIESGYSDPRLEQGISAIPQKAIARLAGLGFIGKSNLLVTEEYGSAFCMCSVLTDAPLIPEHYSLVTSRCGNCKTCFEICPSKAILGNEWTQSGGREALVDVSKCCCPLKCMTSCPWTLKYARSSK